MDLNQVGKKKIDFCDQAKQVLIHTNNSNEQ